MDLSSHIALLSRVTASIAGLVYDNTCPVCQLRSDTISTFPVCSSCFGSLSSYDGPACKVCAKPFVSRYSDICGDCLSDEPAFAGAISYGLYEGVLKKSINQLKFHSVRRLARPLARMLTSLSLPEDMDTIVPVPMTRDGLRRRGYNQSALMAAALGKLSGRKARLDLLHKIKDTPPQVGLSRTVRLKNLRGAFSASDKAKGLNIVVLDDVITTGATMRECANALRKAGAASVTALSLARTY